MPQFDTTWYSGEIFWMLLCFCILFLGMKYFILPLIQDVILEREHIIQNDLNVAQTVNQQADKLMQDYNAHIYATEQTKAEILNETYQDIQKFSMHVEAEHEEKFRQQIEETEKKMQQAQAQFEKQSHTLALSIATQLAQKLASRPARPASK